MSPCCSKSSCFYVSVMEHTAVISNMSRVIEEENVEQRRKTDCFSAESDSFNKMTNKFRDGFFEVVVSELQNREISNIQKFVPNFGGDNLF